MARMFGTVGTVVEEDQWVIWDDIGGLAEGWRQFRSLLGPSKSDGSRGLYKSRMIHRIGLHVVPLTHLRYS